MFKLRRSHRESAAPTATAWAEGPGDGSRAHPPKALPLSELPAGSEAILSGGQLPDDELRLLAAIGLSMRAPVRVCRQGEPCIVLARSTRVGLSRAVAERLIAERREG